MSLKRSIDILARIWVYRCRQCGNKLQLCQKSRTLTPPPESRFYDLTLEKNASEELTIIWDELYCDNCNISYNPKEYRQERRREKRSIA